MTTTPPQVAVNTRTLDTHERTQVEACPVSICTKRKLIYLYNKKEILLQVKMKGMRNVAKYSWYITGADRRKCAMLVICSRRQRT